MLNSRELNEDEEIALGLGLNTDMAQSVHGVVIGG